MSRIAIPLLLIFLCGCIGTDFVELANEPQAIIQEVSLILKEGEEQTLTFQFLNSNGEPETTEWAFVSQNLSVATVSGLGAVSGVSAGQTLIVGTAAGEYSDSVLVTVVADSQAVAEVLVRGDASQLNLGDSLQLTAEVRNVAGETLEGAVVEWRSDDPAVATVDADGWVVGQSTGNGNITASYEGVNSVPYSLQVVSNNRSGNFSGQNGYSVSGTATLTTGESGALLSFAENFRSQSGPGLYVYLSPIGNGVSGGIELDELKSNSGAQEYALPEDADPADYEFVIIYCKPFGVPFGAAQLQ